MTFVTAPDYETPTDDGGDNLYNVTIVATDKAGATTTHELVVTVTDENESPRFADGLSGSVDVAENTQAVGNYLATDDDAVDTVSYSLSGDDADKFALDSDTGELTFLTVPDHEIPTDKDTDNVYKLKITASSGTGDRLKTTEHALEVTVTDVNDNDPKFVDGLLGTASVAENVKEVEIYTATDADASDTVTYSLDGVDKDLFSVSGRGVLAFKDAPDFETPGSSADPKSNVYNVTIVASDGTNTDEHELVVTVTDVNESPEFASDVKPSVSVAENATFVGTYKATDDDPVDTVSYSLSGDDEALFNLNATTGRLTFKNAPNYEDAKDKGKDNVYNVTITASSGTGDRLKTNPHALEVTVTDVNEGPRFVNSLPFRGVDVAENTKFAGNYAATDADASDEVTYSLVGGVDKDLFAISDKGELTFVTAPDHEDPKDKFADNLYSVTVRATGGTGDRAKSIQYNLRITVTNVAETKATNGNDTLDGGTGADTLAGMGGDDVYIYYRGGGKDTITDTAGTDTIRFGVPDLGVYDKIDDIGLLVLEFSSSDMIIKFREDTDSDTISTTDILTVTNAKTTGRIEKFQFGNDIFDVSGITAAQTGYGGANSLTGKSGDDWLSGGGGNDNLKGGGGDDYIIGGAGADSLYGEAGDDMIYGGRHDDYIRGGAGNDTLYGGESGADKLYGDDGNDTLYGGYWRDNLYGGSGNDILYGEDHNDNLYGNDGNDKLYGGVALDNLYGGAGNDTLYGGASRDKLYGGSDDDVIYGGSGDDTIEGGTGNDVIYGESGHDVIRDDHGNNKIYGGSGNDYIDGAEGNDTLDGGAGNDTLKGRSGNDYLIGGEGNDSLDGYDGNDNLHGENGNDVYIYRQRKGQDIITDTGGSDTLYFPSDNNEVIEFKHIEALTKNVGDLIITFKDYFNSAKDKITIKNWSDNAPVIETFRFQKTNTDYKYALVGGNPTLVKKTSTSLDEEDDLDVGFTDSDSDEGYTDLLGLPSDFSPDLL